MAGSGRIKGKQIVDDSVDLKKLSSGIKLLSNDSKLGINKTPSEITDPKEYVTKEYVDTLSDDIDNETIIIESDVLKVNLKSPVDSDEIEIKSDGTNGIHLDKSDISATVLAGDGLLETTDIDGIKTLDVNASNVAVGEELDVKFGTNGNLVVDIDELSNTFLNKVDNTSQTVISDVYFNSGDITFDSALTTKDKESFSNDQELVSKGYVDSVAQGLDWKESAILATDIELSTGWTYTIDPSGSTSGWADTLSFTSGIGSTDIDTGSSISLTIGDRILVKDQTDLTQNGIYELTAVDTLTRADDHNGSPINETSAGNAIFIEQGTYENTGWILQGIGELTLNTDDLVFIQFSGAGQIVAGTGLLKTGDTIDVELATDSGLTFDVGGASGKLLVDAKTPTSTDIEIQLTGGVHILKSDVSATIIAGNALDETVDGDGIKTLDVNSTDLAGPGLSSSSGTDLEVNVDDTTIEISSDILQVKANGINNTHIDYGTSGNQVFAGSIPTEGYVWQGSAIPGDDIQGVLESLDADIQSVGGATTASNGLTKVVSDIQLGGTLTSNTTVSGDTGTYNLDLNGMNNLTLATDSGFTFALNNTTDAVFTDSANSKGIEYAADYTANFTDNSLITKQYVDTEISNLGNQTTAGNGLTISGDEVQLGGILTQNTDIDLSTFDLTFTSDSIQYAADYSGTYTNRSLVDKEYVDTEISNLGNQTTAGNGLTISGDEVQLGGILTQNTTIDGDLGTHDLTINQIGTLTLATSSGYSLAMNGTATFTDTANTKGIEYAADYSVNFTDNSLITKKYVDDEILIASTSGHTQWDTIEITGFGASGTSGQVSYLGTLTFVDDAIDEAQVYINGLRLDVPTQAYFETPGDGTPSVGDTLYFDLDELGYEIETDDCIVVTYLITT